MNRLAILTLPLGSCHVEGLERDQLRTVTLVPGGISLLAPNNVIRLGRNRALEQQPVDVVCLELPIEYLRRYMEEHPAVHLSDLSELHTLQAFDPVVSSMALALRRSTEAGVDDSYLAGAAHYLAAHLLHPHYDQEPRRGALHPQRLQAVTGYMRRHLSSRITLDDMARQVLLSRYYFTRQFAAATGKTPFRYLNELRMESACRQLVTDNESIALVGRRCGFTNSQTFSRMFRKHMGCSPSQYRRSVRHT
ncbi:helix-turn-helix domain-containing protein [Streptomyces sp. NPDC050560]|uniref:helix-turn-helix domain-containing protein n=1 Tax=Streptomyces sp. NPDC050560 TaxID=3365630 RepID=UPI0037AB2C5D